MVPEEHMDGRENMTSLELDAVCDILFLCLNWFREIINLFSRIDDEDTRRLVMIRLKNVLTLEERLKGLLHTNAQYRPPNILFSEDTASWSPPNVQDKSKAKKKGAGKKGGKGKKTVEGRMDESSMNATVHVTTQVTQGGPVASSTLIGQSKLESTLAAEGPKSVQLAAYRPFFRELDLEVFNIFNFVVVTTETEPAFHEEKADPQFRPPELLFLLKDLAIKVDKRLISTGKKKGFPSHGVSPSSFGFTNLMSVPESIVVEKMADILPKLFANLDIIKDYFERLIHLNDGIMDSANMYNETCALYLQCLKNGFDVATSFFSWNGFQSSEMSRVLLSCLKGLVERLQVSVTESEAKDIKLLAEKTVSYLLTFTENILSSEVASSHLSLLNAVAKIDTTSQKNKVAVAETAQAYCKRSWQTAQGKETGAKFNVHVEKFFSMSLEYAKDPMSEMTKIFDVGVPDVFENRGKEFSNTTYQTISRGTLGVLYQVSLMKLGNLVKKLTYGVTKDKDDLLEAWTKSTYLLQKIINPLKAWRNRAILKAVLKHSKPFIDHFLKHGMSLLENTFKRRSTDCIDVIKTLQSSTRYLQVICTSAKADNDIALANYVPILKKSLETSVYRVHAMLAANNCGSAFWLGNLKNKDLEGQEIMSQVTEEGEEEEEEDNDEEEDGDEEDPGSEGEVSVHNDDD